MATEPAIPDGCSNMPDIIKYFIGLGLMFAFAAFMAECQYDFGSRECVKHQRHNGKFVGWHCMNDEEIRKEIYRK